MIEEKRVIKRNLKREKVRTLKRKAIRRIYYDLSFIFIIYAFEEILHFKHKYIWRQMTKNNSVKLFILFNCIMLIIERKLEK